MSSVENKNFFSQLAAVAVAPDKDLPDRVRDQNSIETVYRLLTNYSEGFGQRVIAFLNGTGEPDLVASLFGLQQAEKNLATLVEGMLDAPDGQTLGQLAQSVEELRTSTLSDLIAQIKTILAKQDDKQVYYPRFETAYSQDSYLQPLVMQWINQVGGDRTVAEDITLLQLLKSIGRNWDRGLNFLYFRQNQGQSPLSAGIELNKFASYVLLEPEKHPDYFTIVHLDPDSSGVKPALGVVDAYNWPTELQRYGWVDAGADSVESPTITPDQVKKIAQGQAIILSNTNTFISFEPSTNDAHRPYPTHDLRVEYFVDFTTGKASLMHVSVQVTTSFGDTNFSRPAHPIELYKAQSDQLGSGYINDGQFQFSFSSLKNQRGEHLFPEDTSGHSLPLEIPLDELQFNLLAPHVIDRAHPAEPNRKPYMVSPFPISVVRG